jgi:hypothetical protein
MAMENMQAEEKRIYTDILKFKKMGLTITIINHNSRREISKNSNESHEESGHKSAGNTLHHDHSEDQEQHAGEKSGHEHFGEGGHHNHDQHEEIKHEQHKESKHPAHEQHNEMKHQGHEKHEGMKHEGYEPSRETIAITMLICLQISKEDLSFLLY